MAVWWREGWFGMWCLFVGFGAGCRGSPGQKYQQLLKESSATPATCLPGVYRCSDELLLSCDEQTVEWKIEDTCTSADRCNSRTGGCSACEPGMARCRGVAREVCAEDGSAWEEVQSCGSASTCNPLFCGQCPNPGEVDCQARAEGDPDAKANVLVQCVPDLGWQPLEACETEALCERTVDIAMSDIDNFTGGCAQPVCDSAGELRCFDNILQRCGQGRQMWNMVDTCDSAELCERAVADAFDPADAATITQCPSACGPPGSYRCDGQDILRCRDDQTAEDVLATCPEGRSCDPLTGTCRGPCSTGEYRCNGAALEKCGNDEEWALVEQCATHALCSEVTGECLVPLCAADTYECDQNMLLRCNADQNGFVVADACASEYLCNALDQRCDPPVCPQDDYQECTADNSLRRCTNGRSEWETVETCAEGSFCNADPSAGANCLTECPDFPYQCIGNVLRGCSDDAGVATWTDVETCATAALCQAGLTLGACALPVCGVSLPEYQCLGETLQRCNAERTRWEDVQFCTDGTYCDPGPDGAGPGGCVP